MRPVATADIIYRPSAYLPPPDNAMSLFPDAELAAAVAPPPVASLLPFVPLAGLPVSAECLSDGFPTAAIAVCPVCRLIGLSLTGFVRWSWLY